MPLARVTTATPSSRRSRVSSSGIAPVSPVLSVGTASQRSIPTDRTHRFPFPRGRDTHGGCGTTLSTDGTSTWSGHVRAVAPARRDASRRAAADPERHAVLTISRRARCGRGAGDVRGSGDGRSSVRGCGRRVPHRSGASPRPRRIRPQRGRRRHRPQGRPPPPRPRDDAALHTRVHRRARHDGRADPGSDDRRHAGASRTCRRDPTNGSRPRRARCASAWRPRSCATLRPRGAGGADPALQRC